MFCEKCGNKMPDTARFCPKCGEQVEEPAIMQEQSVNLDGIVASLADKANAILQNAKPVIAKGAEAARQTVNESVKTIKSITEKSINQSVSKIGTDETTEKIQEAENTIREQTLDTPREGKTYSIMDRRLYIELFLLLVGIVVFFQTKDFRFFIDEGSAFFLRIIMFVGFFHLLLLIYDLIKAIKNKFHIIYIIRMIMDIIVFITLTILPDINLNTFIYGPNWYK